MVLETGVAVEPTTVEVGGRTYKVVADLTTVYRLLFTGRVVDALDGEPLTSAFAVGVDREGLAVKTTRDGFFAVSAFPELALSDLENSPYDIGLTVTAAGYHAVEITVAVPAAASFPLGETQVELGRLPVRLQGRVVEVAGEHPPIPGASVSFAPTQILVLRTPLHLDHNPGTPVVGCDLNPVDDKFLAGAASAGEATLTLSDRQDIAVGSVLRLGPELRWEVGVVESLALEPADPGQPGDVTLTAPLRRSFPTDTPVQRVTVVEPLGSATLVPGVRAGAGVLPLDGPIGAPVVRLEGALDPNVEYHVLGALTDEYGYYRLDGIDRPPGVPVSAQAPGFDPEDQDWVVDFAQPVNVVDFRLETI